MSPGCRIRTSPSRPDRARSQINQAAFPDSKTDLDAVFGEGDLVATHWTVRGKHEGELFGIPATGKRVAVEGMNMYRLADTLITDVWTQLDGLGLMEQLGAAPSDAP